MPKMDIIPEDGQGATIKVDLLESSEDEEDGQIYAEDLLADDLDKLEAIEKYSQFMVFQTDEIVFKFRGNEVPCN